MRSIDRHSSLAIRGVLLLAAPLVASGAWALDVDTLVARVQNDTAATVRIAGRAPEVSLSGAGAVVLTLDVFTFGVPAPSGKRPSRPLVFHGAKGALGLKAFSFSPRTGRFRAVLTDVPVSGLPDPFPLRLTAGTTTDCALVRFSTKAVARRRHGATGSTSMLRLARMQLPGKCDTIAVVALDPATAMAGTETSVRVAAKPPAGVDAASVMLWRADGSGAPAGSPLCVLVDDGSDAHGDELAGDGIFGCIATFNEATLGVVPLVVQATLGGKPIGSMGFGVRVAAPLTDADAEAIVATQTMADQIWQQNVARDGYTARTQLETLQALQQLAGVAEVRVGGDGLSIEIVYPSGVIGSLLWAPRFEVEGATPAAGAARAATTAPSPAPAESRVRDATSDRTIIGDDTVLLWDPGFFGPSETTTALNLMTASLCPHFDPAGITFIRGADANVASLANLTQYATVALVTHGSLDRDLRTVFFVTGERATPALVGAYHTELQAKRLLVVDVDFVDYLAVEATYVARLPGTFNQAMIYAGFCDSAKNPTMLSVFLGKGAAAYYGYTNIVSDPFAKSTGNAIFTGLVKNLQTALATFASLTPKLDPYPGKRQFGDPRYDADHHQARITIDLAPGVQDVAYLGTPALMPQQSTVDDAESVTLTATLPGAESCTLAYHWTNTATVGHLTDGVAGHVDDFDSTSATATYTADCSGTGSDAIGVAISATGPNASQQSLGNAAATVEVQAPQGMSGQRGPNTAIGVCTSTTTTSTSTTTTTMACTLPDPVISRCADFAISPDVVAHGGTFTVNIDFTAAGAGCGTTACVYCGTSATLQMIDGAPPTNPDGCGLTVGTHTAVFTAEPNYYPICGAACFVAQPGLWGTTHYFIIE